MREHESPLQTGTRSSLVFLSVLTLATLYFYLTADTKDFLMLGLFMISLGALGRSFLKYRKLQFQNGRRLIGDQE